MARALVNKVGAKRKPLKVFHPEKINKRKALMLSTGNGCFYLHADKTKNEVVAKSKKYFSNYDARRSAKAFCQANGYKYELMDGRK